MNEHKNIITVEDEIKEFSDKPVKSSALYKKVKELESNAVPDSSEASVGDVLTKGENGIEWEAPSEGLPDIQTTDAGKVLTVKSDGTGVEWDDVPAELPAIASGDAGKVLKVNSSETGVEWGAASGGSTHYLHNLYIEISGGKFSAQLITDSSATLKKATVADAVANAGFNTSTKRLPASGYRTNSGTTVMVYSVYGEKISHDLIVFAVNTSTGAELTIDLYTSTSGFYVTDTVVSI